MQIEYSSPLSSPACSCHQSCAVTILHLDQIMINHDLQTGIEREGGEVHKQREGGVLKGYVRGYMRIDRFYSKSHNLAIVSSSLVLMNQIWARLYQHQTVARLQICHSKQSDFILKAHLNHIQITYAVH